MNRINVLTSDIYNKISAGEVVERPCNVVKELVENSLDAGATKIVVSVYGGGIEKIIVNDNGHGINREDIDKAVLNHATSKIVKAEDLYKIQTLGFRGEALASICAVSDVIISTKTDGDEFGVKATYKNGVLEDKTDIGMSSGTTIEVDGLFKYIPARLKFLKKEKTEEQEIYSIFTKFILSNYKIAFKLIIEDKVKIDYFGSSLEDAIFEIYGSLVASNLIKINNSHNGILVEGFVGNPSIAKSSKTNQTLFVNKRYITNQTIAFAVERVFENYLMKGMHPFYCLNITINPTIIDVNVHPKKLEVRFSDPTKVFSAVYVAVNNAILDQSAKSDLKEEVKVDPIVLTPREIPTSTFDNDKKEENDKNKVTEYVPHPMPTNLGLYKSDFEKKLDALDISQFKIASEQTSFESFLKTTYKEEDLIDVKPLESKISILGQIFNEFCLVTKNDILYLIDEHAMHERILFDKFSEETNNEKLGVTDFLTPFTLELSPAEESNLIKIEDDLSKLGFSISNFYKNTYRVDSIPTILNGMNLKTFFNKILSSEFISTDKASLIKNKLAREACRAAVKAGQSLSAFEIENLINNLKPNTPLLCPHGRPVIVELTKLDLEKLFKRKL